MLEVDLALFARVARQVRPKLVTLGLSTHIRGLLAGVME
jgi:hypothetical protein